MSTPALTLVDFDGKFKQIKSQITTEVLDLINRSETMKGLVRNYQADDNTKDAVLDLTNKSTAVYNPEEGERKVFISIGADLLKSPAVAIDKLSHELGHQDVEKPGGIVSNARNNEAIGTGVD